MYAKFFLSAQENKRHNRHAVVNWRKWLIIRRRVGGKKLSVENHSYEHEMRTAMLTLLSFRRLSSAFSAQPMVG